MRSRSILATALAFALASGIAGAARADDDGQSVGRALFDEAVALAKDGRYAEACPKLEASLKAYPGIGTRGKLAECYEKLGRVASAWSMWREVEQLAMRAGDETREQIASERAKALETKLSYLTIVVPPASAAPGLSIKKNGQDVDRSKLGQADPIDAGTVTIEVAAPDRKPLTTQVLVGEGQAARFEVPRLERASAPTPAATARAPSAPAPAAPVVESGRVPWQKPVGLGVAGVGVVALGAGVVLGLSAKSTYDGAFDRGACDRGTNLCSATGQNDVEDARSTATLSTVAFVAGAALAAGGLVLYFTAPSSHGRAALAITPIARGAAVSIGGRL